MCHLCGRPVREFVHILWCDECLDEFLNGPEKMDDFIRRKLSIKNGKGA